MKRLSFYFLLLICLSLCCCERDISVQAPPYRPQLVVFGLLNPEEPISITLTQTSTLFDPIPLDLSVVNASVALFEDGIFVENLNHAGEGNYVTGENRKPEIGAAYHLSIQADGFDDLETVPEQIPESIDFESYIFEENAVPAINAGLEAGVLSWDLVADLAEDQFYGIDIDPMTADSEFVNTLTWLIGIEEEYSNVCGIISGRVDLLIPGQCLIETDKQAIQVGIETSSRLTGSLVTFEVLDVRLHHVSPTYYAYLVSLRQPEGIELAFAHPRPLFSNVIGGYGMIGSITSSQVIQIKL